MIVLDKKELSLRLYEFYMNQYGRSDADHFFEQPAVNVWAFERDGQLIVMKCDLKTGEVIAETKPYEKKDSLL